MSWYFLRHGQTRWNVEHRLQGTRDIPLNEKGREQAEVLRDRWRQEGLEFAAVYCSPLQRAVATAEIVTGLPRSRFILDERLLEMRFGAMEGAVYVKSSGGDISSLMEEFLGRPGNYVPLGEGENFRQVLDRAREFLLDVREKERTTRGNILVVSHGGIMHGLLFHLEGKTDINEFWNTPTPNCEPVVWDSLDSL